MSATRLSLALDSGVLRLPVAGRILVLNPGGAADLSALPQDRLLAVQGFRPDHDALAARGVAVRPDLPEEGGFALALVCLPRARDAARALIAAALARVGPGGAVVVDGQKTEGIDAIYREVRARLPGLSEPLAKAHGKIFALPTGATLDDWTAAPQPVADGFVTLPGVFAAERPDAGSALLAAALPERLKGRGVDLGAGWGYLARAALVRQDVTALDLVEADHAALACARLNVTDPRATFHWADAVTFRPARPAHWVVCNPPFHHGRAADPALGQAFLGAAARMLAPEGTLWLVANRHLPYDRTLSQVFREVHEMPGSPAFRLTRASRPFPPHRR
jgi:16S rRNA (guanine1207-N2)-methyltransferase